MYIERINYLNLRMLLEYIFKDLWGEQSVKEASNRQKTIIPSYLPAAGYEEFESICFASVA